MFIAGMPTLDEMLAMITVLWMDHKTPTTLHDGRLQVISGVAAKEEEVRSRCTVVGCSMRAVFSGQKFRSTANAIIDRARQVAIDARVDELRNFYDGRVVATADTRLSGASSRLYDIDPAPSHFDGEPLLRIKQLVKYIWKEEGEQRTSDVDVKSAFLHEDLCSLLLKGGTIDNTTFPPRTLIRSSTLVETTGFIVQEHSEVGSVVVASTNYPVLDFATSLYDWYNAKVGTAKPVGNAGAFMTLILDLGLAEKKDGKLMRQEHAQAKISLTMMRNFKPASTKSGDQHRWEGAKGANHDDIIESNAVKKFFQEHVEVKTLDVSKWGSRKSDMWYKPLQHRLKYYGLTGSKIQKANTRIQGPDTKI